MPSYEDGRFSFKSMNICQIVWVTVDKGWICRRIQFLAGKDRLDLEAKNFLLKVTLKKNFSVLFHKNGRERGTAAHKHLDNGPAHLQGHDFHLYQIVNKVTEVTQAFSFALIRLRVSQTKWHNCDSNWQESRASKLTGKKISCPN